MNNEISWILGLVIPAVLTVAGNVIFYKLIKNKVDRSIEQYKITYSGIFKEKIDIYREILERSYKIKLLIHRYYYSGNQLQGAEFIPEIENFINFYHKNQPFLSDNMLDKLKKIRSEFQFVFERSYEHHSVSNVSGIDPQIRNDILQKYINAGNKIKMNNPFEDLESTIISEMRADLKIDIFRR